MMIQCVFLVKSESRYSTTSTILQYGRYLREPYQWESLMSETLSIVRLAESGALSLLIRESYFIGLGSKLKMSG